MPIRVFMVEDARHMHGVVADLLDAVGAFEVVGHKATEAEARLWIDENPGAWDMMLVDLILEQGTGMGVIPHARKAAAQAPVVVLSDYATPGIRQHCMNLGATAVFQKSVDLDAFVEYCTALAPRDAVGA